MAAVLIAGCAAPLPSPSSESLADNLYVVEFRPHCSLAALIDSERPCMTVDAVAARADLTERVRELQSGYEPTPGYAAAAADIVERIREHVVPVMNDEERDAFERAAKTRLPQDTEAAIRFAYGLMPALRRRLGENLAIRVQNPLYIAEIERRQQLYAQADATRPAEATLVDELGSRLFQSELGGWNEGLGKMLSGVMKWLVPDSVLKQDWYRANCEDYRPFGCLTADGQLTMPRISREEQVNRITSTHAWQLGVLGGVGAIGRLAAAKFAFTLPLAGALAAVASFVTVGFFEAWLSFTLIRNMTFRIFAVYSNHVPTGGHLNQLVWALFGGSLATELTNKGLRRGTLFVLTKTLAKSKKLAELDDLAAHSMQLLGRVFFKTVTEKAAEDKTSQIASSVKDTALGFALLGAFVLLSAALNVAQAWLSSAWARGHARHWQASLLRSAAAQLGRGDVRDLLARGLGALARADNGKIDREEVRYVAGYLAASYDGGRSGRPLRPRAQQRMAQAFADATSRLPAKQLSDVVRFFQRRRLTDSQRVALAIHLYGILLAKGEEPSADSEVGKLFTREVADVLIGQPGSPSAEPVDQAERPTSVETLRYFLFENAKESVRSMFLREPAEDHWVRDFISDVSVLQVPPLPSMRDFSSVGNDTPHCSNETPPVGRGINPYPCPTDQETQRIGAARQMICDALGTECPP